MRQVEIEFHSGQVVPDESQVPYEESPPILAGGGELGIIGREAQGLTGVQRRQFLSLRQRDKPDLTVTANQEGHHAPIG